MDLNKLQSELSKSLSKIVNSTIRSKWKYIRIFYISSSILVSWTIGRWLYLHGTAKLFNYPPGRYIGVPILGSLAFAGDFCKWLLYLGEGGPIVSTNYGVDNYVYINDWSALSKEDKDLYKNLTFRRTIDLFYDGINQFFFTDGENWHKRRQLAQNAFLNQLKSAHLNTHYNGILSNRIFPNLDAVGMANKNVNNIENKVLYSKLRDDLQYAVFAMIYSTSFGHRMNELQRNDPITQKFFTVMHDAVGNAVLKGMFVGMMIPSLKIANFLNHKVFNIFSSSQALDEIVGQWIDDYETKYYKNDSKNDYYIDIMLDQFHKGQLSRQEMLRDSISLFIAGTDTTTHTVEFGILNLIQNPKLQDLLYDELAAYMKRNDLEYFTLKHINQLVYFRAFVFEVLRTIKHVGVSFPRYVSEKEYPNGIKLNGYNVPSGTYVTLNHYDLNHSNQNWLNPFEFDINRFIKDGKIDTSKTKQEYVPTFGIGKRDCAGSSLAKKNLHLLFGHLILRYKFYPKNMDYQSFKIPVIWTNVPLVQETPIIIENRDE